MPTKNDLTSKSTYVDSIGTLKGARVAYKDKVAQNHAFAYVLLPDGKIISGICDIAMLAVPRGTEVVASFDQLNKNWRVC